MRYFTLRVENVSKSLSQNFCLKNLVLNVEPGEIVGILGPQGAGKTSFVSLLTGKLKPGIGKVFVQGLDVYQSQSKKKINIGTLMPIHKFLLTLKAYTYLRIISKVYGRKFDSDYVLQMSERFELDLNKKLSSYSISELRAIQILYAFMEPVDLIVLDEPVIGLDTGGVDWYHRILKLARAKGISVVFTTEIISEVERVCDWVILMQEGRFIAQERGVQFRARTMRKIEMRFSKPIPQDQFSCLPNIKHLYMDGNKLRCLITGDPDQLIKTASQMRVTDFISMPPSLDETFLIYNQLSM